MSLFYVLLENLSPNDEKHYKIADARYTWLCLVPAAPPQNVYGFNISKHDIQVFWEEVPHRDVNGIILEYRVYFNETWDDVFNKSVKFPTTNTTLSFLRPYTFYSIQVLALTIKGDGPKSPPVIVRTEEEGNEQLQRYFSSFSQRLFSLVSFSTKNFHQWAKANCAYVETGTIFTR